jgi:hypothetical protein
MIREIDNAVTGGLLPAAAKCEGVWSSVNTWNRSCPKKIADAKTWQRSETFSNSAEGVKLRKDGVLSRTKARRRSKPSALAP